MSDDFKYVLHPEQWTDFEAVLGEDFMRKHCEPVRPMPELHAGLPRKYLEAAARHLPVDFVPHVSRGEVFLTPEDAWTHGRGFKRPPAED